MFKIKNFILLISITASIHFFYACNFSNSSQEEIEEFQPEAIEAKRILYNIEVNNYDIEVDKLPPNKLLSQLFLDEGLSKSQTYKLTSGCDTIFNVKKFRAGNTITKLYETEDTIRKLHYLIYDISVSEYLVFDMRDSTNAIVYRGEKEVHIVERRASCTIESSLWNAAIQANLPPALAMELSEIYAWSVDFFGLQAGDAFKVVYEEKVIDSIPVGVERIKYAMFFHADKEYYAFPFEQEDGRIAFYDEHGDGVKKAFLKAPLKFTSISSHFSHARKHPVLKITRPHHGVDYAAPVGTPVVSIGNGVVIQKSYAGGAGNMVKIKHNSTYTSAYLHLSRYGKGVAVGARVSQGQVIGYVGSTGVSTGPHLDFRIFKHGKPVNPLKVVSPPSEPISKEKMPEFEALRDSLMIILNNIQE